MPRLVHGLTNEADWESVTLHRPCPVCGSSQGCSTHSKLFVSCERERSQWPMTTGTWLHRLDQQIHIVPARAPRPTAPAASEGRLPLAAVLARIGNHG